MQSKENQNQPRYLVDNLNWDHLRRNMPFKNGEVKLPIELKDGNTSQKEFSKENLKNMRTFADLPCILPVKIRDQNDSIIPSEVSDNEEVNMLQKVVGIREPSEPDIKHHEIGNKIAKNQLKEQRILERQKTSNTKRKDVAQIVQDSFDYPKVREEFLRHVDVIEAPKIVYTKPIVIVYNPNSGKRRNIRVLISQRLDAEKIPYEFLESKKVFDTWLIPQEMDIDKYSALVAVGGDGTFHEVVNGLLHRADKKRIPVAFIGNGSGNDTLIQFNANSIGKALDFIVKGQLIKYDVAKVLIDYEREEDIPEEKVNSNLRYSIINSVFGVSAKITHRAISFKWCCCNPYQVGAVVEFCKLRAELVDIYVDEQLIFENFPSILLGVFNSKYGGGGMNLSPYSVLNDGLIEVLVYREKIGFGNLVKQMDAAAKLQGVQGYDDAMGFYRGKTIRVENKNPPIKKKGQEGPGIKEIQRYSVDGEDLLFREFVKYETLAGELEVIVDFDYLMQDKKHFIHNK
eukprot:403369450